MNSKYIVFALAFLLTFSAIPMTMAATGVLLNPSQVDTHGPRVSSVVFSIIASDSSLKSSLQAGTIQGPEWTFSVGSFNSMSSDVNVAEGSTIGYTFDGIAFNTLHGYLNNYHFRAAMEYLTDYSYLQTTVLSGVAGTATPAVLPCAAYGPACNPSAPTYAYNTVSAAQQLILAGLHPDTSAANANSTTTWCTVGTRPCPGANVFHPTLQYRTDDPLRTGVATGLITAANSIGFYFHNYGRSGSGGLIYGPSAAAVISPGTYVPSTGYNTAPVFNGTYANSTADAWDMYTYGWIASSSFQFQGEIFNSAFVGSTVNFVNSYNRTMDKDSNAILYATTMPQADSAAQRVAYDNGQQVFYLNSFFQNTLFADYVNGWTGYANEPTTGPNTVGGLFYTLLNVHPTSELVGGTFNLALHSAADASGMNPMYNTNWVWQADIWSEIYDSPLATAPTAFTAVNTFINYQTTSYTVSTYSGKLPGGSFKFQTTPTTITNGEEITLNFAKNITWSDGVPFTAKDYQWSLYLWDEALSPKLPDVVTPLSGVLAGPSGLIASKVVNPYEIEIFVNSISVWNLASTIVVVFPLHMMQYLNPDRISTAIAAVDFTQTYASQVGFATTSDANYKVPKAPKWMYYEPSLEVGSGAFRLVTYDTVTGAGQLDANLNYFRTAWYADINATTNTVLPGATWTHNFTISEYINNPQLVTYCGIASGAQGYCPITGKVPGESSVKVKKVVGLWSCTSQTGGCTQVYVDGKALTYNLVQHLSYTCKAGYTLTTSTVTPYKPYCYQGSKTSSPIKHYSNGYGLSIDTTGMSQGYYEVVLSTTFSFQGLTRTWYQAIGFDIST